MPRCLRSEKFHEIFGLWERQGFYVTPVHFYQPIPDTQRLPDTLWARPSELVGVSMNDSVQLDLLRNLTFQNFLGRRCSGCLLYGPPFSATINRRNRQWFLFSQS